MTGAQLQIQLENGNSLYGFACPAHGLRYAMEGRCGDTIMAEKLTPVGSTKRLQNGDLAACDVCGQPLAFNGFPTDSIVIPDECLAELEQYRAGAALPQGASPCPPLST